MSYLASAMGNIGRHFRSTISAGLVVTIPLGVTALIINFAVDWFDPLLKPAFESFLGEGDYKEGMGIGALIVLIYVAGLLTTVVVGRRLIDIGHRLIGLVPVVRAIYGPLLQFTEVLSSTNVNQQKYSGVVLVDFPKEGSKAVGLITSRVNDSHGHPTLAVFVPTTPVPTSGFLLMVAEQDTIPVDVTVDEAMKLIVSGGILTPDTIMHPKELQASDGRASNH